MNIVEALTDHHDTLRSLYGQAENDPALFETFVHHLIVHHTMEEKYFYDLLKQFEEAEHDSLEAVNEHHIIELIIKDAQGFPRDHSGFPVKIEGLGEYTVHHLEEEELEIFPLASRLFSLEEMTTLGALFEEAKEQLLGVSLPEIPKALAGKFAEPQVAGVRTAGGGSLMTATARGLGIGKL
ncbi:hemerythrin domain-containing protein [Desulfosediminicola ganghwensis]|uniref:hemerythrin domain-containing protein n=1 Tax=Desulfosediminicola ganghwensis TaxID=2569540 RepID=UPI0010ACB2CB|nr:hemerythrin domain-containing protein [Desulfosediminicola ganghwensis]